MRRIPVHHALRFTLVLIAAAAVAMLAGRALATTVYANSWGCAFQGSTYYSSGTFYGYTAEDLPYDCSTQVVLYFSYKENGVCVYGDWQSAASWYLGDSHTGGTGAVSDHQIYVPPPQGQGYGQWEGTYYPSEVC